MKVIELNRALTCCLGACPPANVADQIRKYQDCDIPFKERWTQVGMLFWLYDDWAVLYCDVEQQQVTLDSLCTTLMEADEKGVQVYCFPHLFDVSKAMQMLGTPFSWRKLKAFKDSKDWGKIGSDAGVTCAEYLVMCSLQLKGVNDKLAMHYKPVDWQMLGKDNIERLQK